MGPRSLDLVVERPIPLELAEQLRDPSLLAASDELLQRAGDRRPLRALAAEAERSFQQVRVESEIRRQVMLLVSEPTYDPQGEVFTP